VRALAKTAIIIPRYPDTMLVTAPTTNETAVKKPIFRSKPSGVYDTRHSTKKPNTATNRAQTRYSVVVNYWLLNIVPFTWASSNNSRVFINSLDFAFILQSLSLSLLESESLSDSWAAICWASIFCLFWARAPASSGGKSDAGAAP
jgi:hypothetical protein